MQESHTTTRIHGLDSLRAILMMLGVVIHSALAYFPPKDPSWAFQDPEVGSEFSYFIVEFIHLFRMPAFFLLSGFFGALLWMRRKPREMMINRFKRIVLPLLVFLIPLTYLTDFSAEYGERLLDGDPTPFYTACGIPLKWLPESTMHLWFLYDLVIITALHAAVVALVGRFNVSVERTHRFVRDMVDRPWFFLVFMGLGSNLISWVFFGGDESIPTSDAWIPHPSLILYYWFWYFIGWGIYTAEANFRSFEKPAWGLFFAGCLFWAFGMNWLASVAFIQSSMGLFLRYADAPSARWRYLSDSAYWVYLLHLPFTIFIPALIMNWPLPYALKLGVCIAIVTAICLLSYSAFVRSTWIGHFLNGRRYAHPRRRVGVVGFALLGAGTAWATLNPPAPEDRPERPSPWRDERLPTEILSGEYPGTTVVHPFPDAKLAGVDPESCVHFVDQSPVENQGTTLFCVAGYDYKQAVAACEKMGAELANLEEFDESAKVVDVAVTLTGEPFYIDLTDLAEEGEWVWGNGAVLEETHWAEGEPNSWGGKEEDCAAINYADLAGWIDLPCDAQTGFVCEFSRSTEEPLNEELEPEAQ